MSQQLHFGSLLSMHNQAEKALNLAGTYETVCQTVAQESEWFLAVNVHMSGHMLTLCSRAISCQLILKTQNLATVTPCKTRRAIMIHSIVPKCCSGQLLQEPRNFGGTRKVRYEREVRDKGGGSQVGSLGQNIT